MRRLENFQGLGRRGMHGITILLIFIAVLVISLMIGGYFLIQADQLSGEANKQLDRTNGEFKHLQIINIVAEDGRDQYYDHLVIDVKLIGDTEAVALSKLGLSIGEPDYRTQLIYRENGQKTNNNSGYITWSPQELGTITNYEHPLDFSVELIDRNDDGIYTLPVDLDGDGINETIFTCDNNGPCPAGYDGTHMAVYITSEGDYEYVELRNDDGTLINISSAGAVLDITKARIGDWGHISLAGTISIGYEFGWGANAGTVYDAPVQLDADLDDDGENDYVAITDTEAVFIISSLSSELTYPLGGDLSSPPATISGSYLVTNGERLATLEMSGTTSTAHTIDEDINFTITPYHNGGGYYYAEHLIEGNHPLAGRITAGDVIRIHAETYRPIEVNEVFNVYLLYDGIEQTSKIVYVGDTIPNKQRVGLFPRP